VRASQIELVEAKIDETSRTLLRASAATVASASIDRPLAQAAPVRSALLCSAPLCSALLCSALLCGGVQCACRQDGPPPTAAHSSELERLATSTKMRVAEEPPRSLPLSPPSLLVAALSNSLPPPRSPRSSRRPRMRIAPHCPPWLLRQRADVTRAVGSTVPRCLPQAEGELQQLRLDLERSHRQVRRSVAARRATALWRHSRQPARPGPARIAR
jgi:hypothetical protein